MELSVENAALPGGERRRSAVCFGTWRFGEFSPSRPLENYTSDEILWCRPESDTVYYEDKIVIFGHTPVQLLEPGAPAKIYRRGNLIDIDCGCAFPGGRLGCLCLDTLEEIYV